MATGRQNNWPRPLDCWGLAFVLGLGLLLRLCLFGIVIQDPRRAATPDSDCYIELGDHFGSAFLANSSMWLKQSTCRPPLYPLFCAMVFAVSNKSIGAILAAQIAVSLATVLLVYVLCLTESGRAAAFTGGLLLSIEPLSIIYCNYVMSEVLFSALLFAAWYTWHRTFASNRHAGTLAAGFLFGMSALVRPVTTYLLLFILPVELWRRHGGIRTRAAWTLLFAVAFLIPVGSYMSRNYVLTGHWFVSSIEGTNLLYYRAAGAIAEETGQSRLRVARGLESSFSERFPTTNNPGEVSRLQKREAFRLLVMHPRGVFLTTANGFQRLTLGPGFKSLSRLLHGQQRYDDPAATCVVLQVVQVLVLCLVYLLAIAGVAYCIRRRRWDLLATLGCLLFYLAIVSSGSETYSRFRLPLMPFLCVLGGLGGAALLRAGSRFRGRFRARSLESSSAQSAQPVVRDSHKATLR